MPTSTLVGLPNHTPHRETRFCRAEKILHALMLEAHLVKELLAISFTSISQHRRQDPQRPVWREYGATVANHGEAGQIPNCIFYRLFERGRVSHHVVEDRRVAGVA